MKTWALVIAAGRSKRFNGVKPLASWNDRCTLLEHAVATVRPVTLNNIMIINGAHRLPAIPQTRALHNPDWKAGMGTSIATGIKGILDLSPEVSIILLMTVDQPLTTTAHLEALCRMAQKHDQTVFTAGEDFISPPVALIKNDFKAALSLSGEKGLKSVVPTDIHVQNPAAVQDADTPAQLAALQPDS